MGRGVGRENYLFENALLFKKADTTSGGEGGIRTRVGCNNPNRFRVGAVVTASVPLLYFYSIRYFSMLMPNSL